MSERYVEVGLELDAKADPIAGRVRQGQAAPQPFAGWLELAAVLEEALSRRRQASDGDARVGGGAPGDTKPPTTRRTGESG